MVQRCRQSSDMMVSSCYQYHACIKTSSLIQAATGEPASCSPVSERSLLKSGGVTGKAHAHSALLGLGTASKPPEWPPLFFTNLQCNIASGVVSCISNLLS